MIRQPTPESVALRWHRDAVADLDLGLKVSVNTEPQCGYFETRLAKGGVMVPARIWIEREIDETTGELLTDEVMRAEINGREADPQEVWDRCCGRPISEDEFEYLTARRNWAAWHEPENPAAQATKPVDWLTVALPGT